MLKIGKRNIALAALCAFGAIAVSSCEKKVSDTPLYGLIEGTYHYESQEGVLPADWSFNADSKFEFMETGPNESYDENIALEDGSWQMQKCTFGKNGERVVNRNGKMIWSNTRFDSLPYLKVAGAYTTKENAAVLVMISPSYGDSSNVWGDGFKGIQCTIAPLAKNDYSKRRISIFFKQTNEAESTFTVNFSM